MNPEPVEMYICEINHLILKPDVHYVFRFDPECKSCRRYCGVVNHEPCSECQGTGGLDATDCGGEYIKCEPCHGTGVVNS